MIIVISITSLSTTVSLPSDTLLFLRLMRFSSNIFFSLSKYFFFQINVVLAGNEIFPMERPDGMPTIKSLEVMCGKDHMDVHLSFSAPFDGIVSSKGL